MTVNTKAAVGAAVAAFVVAVAVGFMPVVAAAFAAAAFMTVKAENVAHDAFAWA